METQVSTVLEIQRLRTRREIIVDINFNTDRLVVLNYPVGAGGKFISLALGLHQNILIQEQTMARLMMQNRVDPTMRFKLAMKTFEKTEETNSHFEFGCSQLSGFNSGMLDQDKTADEKGYRPARHSRYRRGVYHIQHGINKRKYFIRRRSL